jgi:hypothetical protein
MESDLDHHVSRLLQKKFREILNFLTFPHTLFFRKYRRDEGAETSACLRRRKFIGTNPKARLSSATPLIRQLLSFGTIRLRFRRDEGHLGTGGSWWEARRG